MKKLSLLVSIISLSFPFVASAASVTLSNLSSASVMVANQVSLDIVASGLTYTTYSLQDSFAGSTASSNQIGGGGHFAWVPSNSDIGTHTLTFTAFGSEGSASGQQVITVLPPPSMNIGALNPGSNVMPGTALTFQVTTTGFVNPTFSVGDVSSNPLPSSSINASGYFSWTPTLSDNGDHTITVYVSDATGRNASKSVSVHVGAGPSLSTILLSPGASVKPGQLVTFTAVPSNFQPTGFSVWDSFAGSTAGSNNMSLSGQFSWTPSQSDVGVHTLMITGVVGAFGASASTTQRITVLNADGSAPAGAVTTTPTTPASGGDTTLAALQAKLALLTGSLTAAQSGSTSSGANCTLVSYLKSGSSGDEVLCLQKMLVKSGYLSATPNGNYGPATMAAVKAFQKAKGLDQLGVVGPGTRAALNGLSVSAAASTPTTTSASGNRFLFEHFMGVGDDDANEVMALQQRLTELGYYSASISGYYGPATEAGVKLFQKANGIPETGYVASITRAALNK